MTRRKTQRIGYIRCKCGKEGYAYLWRGRLEIKHPVIMGTQTTLTFTTTGTLADMKQKTCYVRKAMREDLMKGNHKLAIYRKLTATAC